MRIEYDQETDGAYIWIVDIDREKSNYEKEVWPTEFNEEIGFLFTRRGKLMGIEIQPASKYLDSTSSESPERDSECNRKASESTWV